MASSPSSGLSLSTQLPDVAWVPQAGEQELGEPRALQTRAEPPVLPSWQNPGTELNRDFCLNAGVFSQWLSGFWALWQTSLC